MHLTWIVPKPVGMAFEVMRVAIGRWKDGGYWVRVFGRVGEAFVCSW